MATNLPRLAAVERLSPRVIRILGGNPGKVCISIRTNFLVADRSTYSLRYKVIRFFQSVHDGFDALKAQTLISSVRAVNVSSLTLGKASRLGINILNQC